MSSNTFKYVDWLSMETLRILKNKLQVAQFFNTDDNDDYDKEFPVGATIRKKFPQRFLIREGLAYSPQAINRRETTITIDQIIGVDFEWDSFEAALKMERGEARLRKEYIEPAAAQIAQELDSRAANWARYHSNNFVGVLGTNPTAFSSISGSARQTMVELACPPGGQRGMIIPPKVNTSLANTALAVFNPDDEISRIWKEGTMGVQGGFKWYESMSLYNHTAGTWAGTVSVTSTMTSASDGTTSLTLTCTNGDIFKKGDKFSIASVNATNPSTRRSTGSPKLFTNLSADQTVSGTSVTLTISPAIYGPGNQYQNIDAYPVAAAALTLFPGTTSPNAKQGTVGLAIHESAFALAGVKLEVPKACEVSSQTRDPETGLAVRFIRMFDPQQSKMVNRFDCAFGFGDLYVDNSIAVLSA
jgi:P22 coat protein - gene protein 5